MLLSFSLGEVHPFVLALLILAVGFGMRRSVMRRTRRRFDPIGDAQQDLRERVKESRSELHQHEVRLSEVARDAEATLQTKIAVLDQMVSAADQEIARLEELLAEIRDIPSPRVPSERELRDPDETLDEPLAPNRGATRLTTPTTVESDQFIRLLRQSGFSPAEIASSMQMSERAVRRILCEETPDEGEDRISRAA